MGSFLTLLPAPKEILPSPRFAVELTTHSIFGLIGSGSGLGLLSDWIRVRVMIALIGLDLGLGLL